MGHPPACHSREQQRGDDEQRYGERVNLVSFIGEMDINDIMSMTVGTLAGYVEAAELAGVPADPG